MHICFGGIGFTLGKGFVQLYIGTRWMVVQVWVAGLSIRTDMRYIYHRMNLNTAWYFGRQPPDTVLLHEENLAAHLCPKF